MCADLVFCVNMIIKTYILLLLGILADISVFSFWLLSKFGNMVIQLKFYLLGMLSGPEKIVRRIVFLFFNKMMADESHDTLKSLNCFTNLFQGSNLPWPYVD